MLGCEPLPSFSSLALIYHYTYCRWLTQGFQRHRAKTNGMSQNVFRWAVHRPPAHSGGWSWSGDHKIRHVDWIFMVPDGRVSIEPNHEYQLFIQFLGMSMILTQWIFFTVLHSRTHLDDMVGAKSGLNPPKPSTQNIHPGFLLRCSKDINTGLFHPTKSRRFMCLPSGELTVCNGKWPSRNSGFSHE